MRGTRTLSSASAQVAYTLDAAGNLTSDGLRSFNMDANGRLAQVRIGLGSEEAATVYLHNALGQRVFKSEPQATQYAPDEEELGSDFINWLKKNFGWLFAKAQANATLGQSFVYADGPLPTWALLGEYGNGGSKSAGRLEVIWLPTEDGGAIPIGLYRNGRFHAVHPDHLGTPRLITDEANLPVWQWPYSAFGANKPTGILKATQKPKQAWTNEPTLLKATNPALTFNLRYPGQYFDEESNLNYNYFRSYMPAQGRYSQPDPIGLEGGMNRFGYGEGNAIWSADPFGQNAAVAVVGVCALISGTMIANSVQNQSRPQSSNWVDDPLAKKEHEQMRTLRCTPPPKNLLGCALLKWKRERNANALELYKLWDGKWLAGRHANDIKNLEKSIAELDKQIERDCRDCP